ncbi:Chromobox -like protein 7 [Halotydeus destructor]|nr:Chromobox -like protein 7 [Halotydeus destructor]
MARWSNNMDGYRKRRHSASAKKRKLSVSKATQLSATSEDSDVFVVEKIIGKRVLEGRVEYRIKWAGYPVEEATWEPIANIYDPGLVEAYEAKSRNVIQIIVNRSSSHDTVVSSSSDSSSDSSDDDDNDTGVQSVGQVSHEKEEESRVLHVPVADPCLSESSSDEDSSSEEIDEEPLEPQPRDDVGLDVDENNNVLSHQLDPLPVQ